MSDILVDLERPFAVLHQPVHEASRIIECFDGELGAEIQVAAPALTEIEVDEDNFLKKFFTIVRSRYGSIVEDKFPTTDLLASAAVSQQADILGETNRIGGLVNIREVYVVAEAPLVKRAIGSILGMRNAQRVDIITLNTDVANAETKLRRSSHNLAEKVVLLVEDPVITLVERAVSEHANSLGKAVSIRKPIFPARSVSRPEVSKEIAEIVINPREEVSVTEPKSEIVINPRGEASVSEPKKEFAGEGKVEFDLPWMDGQDQHAYRVIDGVPVIEAMTSNLRNIADKIEANKRYAGKLEGCITVQARRIGSGILPWANNRGIGKSSGPHKDIYGDTDIWYTKDQSPNSPKIFFTVKETPVELREQGASEFMLLVVAKTDKHQEIETLQHLTDLSRATLKTKKAGSV